MKLIAEDDKKAFRELFDRHWYKAYRTVLSKTRSRDKALEIVHDLFLSFWERRHSFEVDNFAHYLAVAVKYRIITYFSRELSRERKMEDLDVAQSLETSPLTGAVEYEDLMKAVERGVQHLPAKTQQVFRLNRLEGRSVPEIARQLNLSEKAIQYHITRSVKELRLYLKDYLLMSVWIAQAIS